MGDERATADEFVQRAKRLAEDFQLPQALLAARRARQLDEFNVEAHYLGGALARRMDRLDEAIQALERACYLEKTLVMGHLLLGHMYQEKAKEALARHHYGQVLKALDAGAADEPVRFADGMSAQMLREMGQETARGAR